MKACLAQLIIFIAIISLNAQSESFVLIHGKDAAPDFMQALIKSRYSDAGYFSKDGLPEAVNPLQLAADHQLYFYSIPRNQIINDGQGFELVVDKTENKFWIRVSGGFGNKNYVFGPAILP
ncbi:MAG: hypothetical protein JWM78_1577 [Verrucomicrobiaceae bacterium]|nr:hypothetical protein [Verrucomicrobiaceae bacterium]